MRRAAAVTAAAILVALAAVPVATAAGHWRTVQRDASTGPRSTSVTVASFAAEARMGRVTVRATRGNVVRLTIRSACANAAHSHRVERVTKASYRSAGLARPYRRVLGPTFPGARCDYFASAVSGGGRLSAVLDVAT
jgi:hypothetical protein